MFNGARHLKDGGRRAIASRSGTDGRTRGVRNEAGSDSRDEGEILPSACAVATRSRVPGAHLPSLPGQRPRGPAGNPRAGHADRRGAAGGRTVYLLVTRDIEYRFYTYNLIPIKNPAYQHK